MKRVVTTAADFATAALVVVGSGVTVPARAGAPFDHRATGRVPCLVGQRIRQNIEEEAHT